MIFAQPRACPAVALLLGRGRGSLLEAVGPAELLAEALDAAGGVDELLLAGEERVALATDVDRDLRQRTAGRERVAARAVGRAGLVTGVDFRFHFSSLLARAREAQWPVGAEVVVDALRSDDRAGLLETARPAHARRCPKNGGGDCSSYAAL